ncbi:hypothetical protein K3165_08920 [Qipengyuania sp. 1XM1-15A]|uniref:hypothetical protein n=1 Tax=Qipengyuania xiamenensis TaxID=2867237 RepID=UPI001C872A3E|nr:hypothetical protein [Qipengyuania xiamenensis]MBX7533041.1 hypothetical protein [Qipengyuania xiamenensis]
MKRLVSVLAVSLVLASCGKDAAEVEERNADSTARGEVLGGTISDDMLPLDTVQSQSPPRAGQDISAGGEVDETSSSEPDAQPDPQPQPEPEPVAEPVSDPEPETEASD